MRRILRANNRPPYRDRRRAGFALVVTLSLMVLMVLIAVGLLQLATISLRSSGAESDMAQARANARVALMLAIGQLQKEMGPDDRISATAEILDTNSDTLQADGVHHPHYSGVWTAEPSRLGDAADATRRWTLDRASYEQGKTSSFRSWLVSGLPTDVTTIGYAKNSLPAAGEVCEVVSPRSSSDPGVKVAIIPGVRSGLAWWTSDNGVKSLVHASDMAGEAKNRADMLLKVRADNADGHSKLDPRIPNKEKGLSRLVDLASVENAVPDQSPKASVELFHDLTAFSESLPVDVTKSGLKKCLNLKLDWLQEQPDNVRKNAGTLGLVPSAQNESVAPKDYRLFAWDQLRHYQSLSRNSGLVTMVNGRPRVTTYNQDGADNSETNPKAADWRFRLQPIMIKMSYLVSCGAERVGAAGAPDEYALRLYFYPMAVLWNPYNVDLVVPEFCPTVLRCPIVLKYNQGMPGACDINIAARGDLYTHMPFGPRVGGMTNLVIPAGGTRALYPKRSPNPKDPPRPNNELYLYAQQGDFDLGINDNYGAYTKNLNNGAEIKGAGTTSVKLSSVTAPVATIWADGAHTDNWGNYGGSSQKLLHGYGVSTHVGGSLQADSPQVTSIDADKIPTRTYLQLSTAPQPLCIMDIYRKAADESDFPSKINSFCVTGNPLQGTIHSSSSLDDRVTSWFESPFSLRCRAVANWLAVTDSFQFPPGREDTIYFGNSYSSDSGQLSVVDQEVPLAPLSSIAELQSLPLFDFKPLYDQRLSTYNSNNDWEITPDRCWFYWGRFTQFAQNHAIGNSYASPGIPAGRLTHDGWKSTVHFTDIFPDKKNLRMDRSYIANAHLWDGWFCSSIAAQDGPMLTSNGHAARGTKAAAENFFKKKELLPNDSITCAADINPDDLLKRLFDASGKLKADAQDKVAAYVRIRGGFNVNSVSQKAWAHFLSKLLSRKVLMMDSTRGNEPVSVVEPQEGKFLITRYALGNAPPAERGTGKQVEDRYWNGSREVTKEQIEELAEAIVKQVKKRGPFLSLSEFVNRRVTSDSTAKDLALCGALQSALDDEAVSINEPFREDVVPMSPQVKVGAGASAQTRSPKYPFPEAAAGPRRQGITGYVTQADILSTVGNSITPRSDTFTVRAMGEARSKDGKVVARAWCEAVIQRSSNFVDPTSQPDAVAASLTQVNKKFGRKFSIVSFRWLNTKEL